MYVPGNFFNDDANHCYIPIFQSGLTTGADKRVIFVGNTFMQHYYTVFDQSIVNSSYYIRIGLAPRNVENLAPAMHYDAANNAQYKPESEAKDSSKIMNGM